MPVYKCSNGKYRIGTGKCIYPSKVIAEKAYKGYLAAKHINKEFTMDKIKKIIQKILPKKEILSKAKLKVYLGVIPERERKKNVLYIANNSNADIHWNINMSLPLPPGSVSELNATDKIRFSNNAVALMNEIHRVLKIGGTVTFMIDKGKEVVPPNIQDYSVWNASTLTFYINDKLRRAQSIFPKFDLVETDDSGYDFKVKMKKVKSGIMKSNEIKEEPVKKNAKFVEIVKIDNEKQIMTGIVFQPEVEDSDKDIVSAEEIEKGMYKFMEKDPMFDVGHDLDIRYDVMLMENYLAPSDLVFKNKNKEIKVKKGSWIMSVKVADELWKEVKDGKIKGFSPWGSALREHNIEEGDNE